MKSTVHSPKKLYPICLKDLTMNLRKSAKKGDIMICGENFGCGSSREHPAVGLAYAGIQSSSGKIGFPHFLPFSHQPGIAYFGVTGSCECLSDREIRWKSIWQQGSLRLVNRKFHFQSLPEKLRQILGAGRTGECVTRAGDRSSTGKERYTQITVN